jgi:hypothetical protein
MYILRLFLTQKPHQLLNLTSCKQLVDSAGRNISNRNLIKFSRDPAIIEVKMFSLEGKLEYLQDLHHAWGEIGASESISFFT